ncbi:hypothetical protein [Methylophilus sp. Leaf408]|uniref:hypothetical protein n=1 Tax=Methylophilus sp. Leaf408 TaxID=2876561 RepID=UPI001E4524ED|nr:hypothetical protein [Methylophilus sp. Leaf408]
MTATTPVEKVAAVLSAANFKRVTVPLNLAGIQFDIPAAFVGTGTSSDLILLVDTAFDSEKRIQQKVEGIARALDSIKSLRPLTTVVAGPRPRSAFIDAMSRVSRVLPLGVSAENYQNTNMLNWLAVLLPLDLPEPEDLQKDIVFAFTDIEKEDTIKMALIESSNQGTEAVESRLNTLISEPLDNVIDEDVL